MSTSTEITRPLLLGALYLGNEQYFFPPSLSGTFGAWLCMVLKLGRFGQQIRNTWKVLKCGLEISDPLEVVAFRINAMQF